MMLLAFLAVGFGCFAAGFFAAALCFMVKEEDVLPYEQAKRCWRRMEGL